METISVIVPVYNTAPYLPECIGSICRQTHENLEIFLIDDGSTDGSGEICEDFARRDSRIRVIHQENRGLSAARNRGLDAARGQYISFVDSDDALAPEMLALLLGRLKETDSDMALCNFLRGGAPTPMKPAVMTPEMYLETLLGPECWYYATMPNRLCRRAAWDGLRFPEGRIHEDEAVIYPLAARCRRIVLVKEALYFYRSRPGSITTSAGIAHSDRVSFLAERIAFCRRRGWQRGLDANCLRFCHTFWEFYLEFPKSAENSEYLKRMEIALGSCIRELLRSPEISLRHKLYFLAVWLCAKLRMGKGCAL